MLVVLRHGCTAQERRTLLHALDAAGIEAVSSRLGPREILALSAEPGRAGDLGLERFGAVERIVPLAPPYRLAARQANAGRTVVRAGPAEIGGGELTVVAGPCAVEDEEQLLDAARAAREAGARLLRGGAFKPRTSPYFFQGLGRRGLELLREAARETGMGVVTEALDPRDVELVSEYADLVQLGSRNMQNYALLREAARCGKPLLLKRGRACTVEEWLCAAEYLLDGGNPQVVLCERGVVSHDPAVRNLLDLSCVPLLRRLTHLPVVVDPSHGTGRYELVPAMARAAVAAGADGVMIEIHPHPEQARSDARQALRPGELAALVPQLQAIHEILAIDAGSPA